MASPLQTSQQPTNDGSPSWLARIIAAIIHDLQYLWSFFSIGYTGSFTDANGNIIEVTDGGVVEAVNPKLQFTVNETFVSFIMTSTTDPVIIEWGDKTQETFVGGASLTYSHTYATAGTYVVRVNGEGIETFVYSNAFFPSPASLLSVDVIPDTLLYLTLDGNSLLSYINMAQFVSCGEFNLSGSPLLTNATIATPPFSFTSVIENCTGIIGIDTTNYAQCSIFVLKNSPLVDELDITPIINATDIDITGLSALRSAVITPNSTFGNIVMEDCTQLTTITLNTLPNISTFSANGCTKLKTITISNIGTCSSFLCGQGTRLSVSKVNSILTTFDGYGTSGGTLDLSGQNPAAIPTGAGATAKANLIGRGWTVTTD